METWESLWQGLLYEAAFIASTRGVHARQRWIEATAASIILACASMEAFLNEFIEWRKLSASKKMGIRDKVKYILEELGKDESFIEEAQWRELAALNRLRNQIVHHKANPHILGEGPEGLLTELNELGVLSTGDNTTTWESLVLAPVTACWACEVVGRLIVQLENIEIRRGRSFDKVREAVDAALAPLYQ